MLRYWEAEFNTIKPKRNSKGTRFYTKKDIAEIQTIHHLVKERGYTLQGAREQLKQNKSNVDEQIEVVNRLEDIKKMLEKLRSEIGNERVESEERRTENRELRSES